MEAFLISTHPFGEHMSSCGQHPPPVAAGHLLVKGRHFICEEEVSPHVDLVELQHTTFEGVNLL